MTHHFVNPTLVPDISPIDVEVCETAQLLNPPHISRVLWDSPEDRLGTAPDWTLLVSDAA